MLLFAFAFGRMSGQREEHLVQAWLTERKVGYCNPGPRQRDQRMSDAFRVGDPSRDGIPGGPGSAGGPVRPKTPAEPISREGTI